MFRNYYKQSHVFQDGNKDGHQKYDSNVVNYSAVQYKANWSVESHEMRDLEFSHIYYL